VTKLLKLGIPKGSLQNSTIALFKRSGWEININGRSYFPEINDPDIECAICRAQEMSLYVESGTLDAGLTGKDWIAENNSDVHVVTDLIYSKVSSRPARWVLAVPYESPIRKIEDLKGKKVATEMVKFTERYFADRKIDVDVEFSWGATEAKVVSGLADAVVEVTETESTIKAHGLRIIHELMQTNTQLIANHDAWQDSKKRKKIEQLSLLLTGALLYLNEVGAEAARVVEVPGAFELPVVTQQLAASGEVDAVVALGAVVNAVTYSGTNTFEANAFGFFAIDILELIVRHRLDICLITFINNFPITQTNHLDDNLPAPADNPTDKGNQPK